MEHLSGELAPAAVAFSTRTDQTLQQLLPELRVQPAQTGEPLAKAAVSQLTDPAGRLA